MTDDPEYINQLVAREAVLFKKLRTGLGYVILFLSLLGCSLAACKCFVWASLDLIAVSLLAVMYWIMFAGE